MEIKDDNVPQLKDLISLQYEGFLDTSPLWMGKGDFGIPQYLPLSAIKVPLHFHEELTIPDNLVLGKRMEYFFEHYLKNNSQESILAKNMVVNSLERTLGELDFLLHNPTTGIKTHLELVYKFYLYDQVSEKEEERWIGPNKSDSLVRKLNKLKTHQFPLLFREETRELLKQLECTPNEFEQKVCFKAHLFLPEHYTGQTLPLINNKCIQGYWIKIEDFSRKKYGKSLFHIPSKWNWPIIPEAWSEWNIFEATKAEIVRLCGMKRSPMVWRKEPTGRISRFFVVWW